MSGAGLVVRVLGPFEVHRDGAPIPLGGAKQQMVLALLAIEANRVVSTDRLIEWVWSDGAADRSPGTLQVYMSNLRRALGPSGGGSPIVTQRPGYVLQLEPEQLDLLEFEQLRKAGEAAMAAGRAGDAVDAFRRALGLWRGDPLDGLPVDPAAGGVLSRLQLAHLAVFEQTAEAELALGRHREFVDELASWLAVNPLDETLRGQLMLALYRCGRQAEALAVYREGRELLVEELGIDPSRELRDLEGAILAQDPSLDLAATRPVAFDDASATVLRGSVVWRPAALEIDGERFLLERAVTTIGRLADRDVTLADSGVSRRHAEVRRIGDAYRLVDVGSANGTTVNGAPVTDHDLADGDAIAIGGAILTFRLE